jgi:hypothetical protein
MYVPWQGMSIVENWPADRATRNAGDSVAKCQERTATVCGVGLQTVQEMQRVNEAFKRTEQSGSCKGRVSKRNA